jgi:hypothetical protein
MNARIFSYKVPGITLGPSTIENLSLSPGFDRKTVLDPLKEKFAADNYKIDEASVSYKLIDDQLYIQGLAIANEEPKTVGFRFGKKD